MAVESRCPSQEALADFVAGRLDDGAAQQIGAHLTRCEACALAVERLRAGAADDVPSTRPWTRLPKIPCTPEAATSHEVESNFDFTLLEPTPCPDALGRLGKYDVLSVLGQGGMGVVLRGFDGQLGRAVALKVLSSHLASSVAARRRFQREGRAAAKISHPNVVTIYHVEDHHGLPFLVMELVKGHSLHEHIRVAGKLEPAEVIRIAAQIAAGLAAAHAQNVIHRDIKPGNVMLQDNGSVKITDFGLARIVFEEGDLSSHQLVVGTPSYMSPEQVEGRDIDARADLFSLGCVMYAMLTGRSPFQGRHALLIDPPSLHDVDASIPQLLTDLVARLLQKNPNDRFQSAGAVADLLGQQLTPNPSSSGVTSGAVQPAPAAVTGSPRRRVLLVVLACMALLLVVGAFAGWHPWSSARQDGHPELPGYGTGRPVPAEITVAAKGLADFRTITEALVAAGPGTIIRVVDGSTYRETLAFADPQRLAGVQLVGAAPGDDRPRPTLAAPRSSARVIDIHNVSGVRIRGFKILGPTGTSAIEIRGSLGNVALEDLHCTCTEDTIDKHPTMVVSVSGTPAEPGPIMIRRCVIDRPTRGQCVRVTGSARSAPPVLLEKNRFYSKGVQVLLSGSTEAPVHAVTVAGNLFLGELNGVNLDLVNPPADQSIRLINNTFHGMKKYWIGLVTSNTSAPGVTIANNLILGASAIEKEPGYLEPALQNWTFKNNWWELDPATPNRDIYAGLAELKEQIELIERDDPDHADFLRPPPGSPLYVSGAGGDLPAHVGARGPHETRTKNPPAN